MRFFYQTLVGSIHSHYEVLFSQVDEEDEDRPQENQGTGGIFEQYGILPLICRVCELTFTPFDTVMGWSVCQTFYLASYIVTKNKYEQDMIKQMQMKNARNR